tara:strand:- start:1419 stop:1766 length:348 start_codon:yes stop_codon:yes gene_type:complete
MEYILHLLLFIFGYITCRTFYFIRAGRLSLRLIVSGHLFYLFAIERALGKYSEMLGRSSEIENDIEVLQSNSIDYLLKLHPTFYREALKFHDWKTAMEYLESHREITNQYWLEED